jgi:hypothetical protein
MVRNVCLIAFLIVSISGSARAAENTQVGTPHSAAEERACGGDARRFCKEAIGDDFRVGSCLQDHKDKLSHACRALLEGHGSN